METGGPARHHARIISVTQPGCQDPAQPRRAHFLQMGTMMNHLENTSVALVQDMMLA